jgi:hypothetical protein
MTKNFDTFFKTFLENIHIQRRGVHLDDYEMFPDVDESELKRGIYLHEWDLKNLHKFKKLLDIADRKGVYIFAQAYPYNSKNEDFEKNTERLIKMYEKLGFQKSIGNYIYRRPRKELSEMTEAGVLGADGPYPTEDPRTPFVMGTYSRRGKIKTRKPRKRKKKYIKESNDVPPLHAGTYTLIRGSYKSNQNSSQGIYANGIHYTTDITTASEFGEPNFFEVTLKNPIVLSVSEIYDIGNPFKVSQILLKKGYDSLVIPHEKEWEYTQDGEDRIEKYTEYEVIVLK